MTTSPEKCGHPKFTKIELRSFISYTTYTWTSTYGLGRIWNSTFGTAANTTISGSFTAVSSSLASRIAAEESEAEGTVLSGSAQIASDISGSFTSTSASFSTTITSNSSSAEASFAFCLNFIIRSPNQPAPIISFKTK